MPLASAIDSKQCSGLRSAARPPLARGLWNIVATFWLAVVLGFFLGIRILGSETVTHLLRKFVAH